MRKGGLKAALERVAAFDGRGVQTGVVDPDVVPRATAAEFGLGAEPRPFLRQAAAEHGKAWGRELAHIAADAARDVPTAGRLERAGEQAAADVRETIEAGDFAPLAPSTVQAKGSDTPLIDSRELVESIASRTVR